ncbi:MAG: uracil-DNA glycosylase [Gemmatimonadetes bacterium]|nr:uracil-DNA glycosylase [Gemmatimonadota bacterium]
MGPQPLPHTTDVAWGPQPLALAGISDSYEALRTAALQCTRCRLHERRTQVVFSDGSPRARVMIVGEAPGQEEDRRGLPFVGPAGKLLDLLLASISLSRESVYICNVVKCRPPSNRNPEPDEIEACHPFLRAQIDFVSPQVILALGSIAAHTLLGRQDALKRLRGVVHRYDGIPVVVTYHPAALLRNAGWTQVAWEDFQLMRRTLELGSGGLRAP